MAKMTNEEKAAKVAEKKAAQKAARLEKKRLQAEKKRTKREAKRAKMLAKREAEKAKKLKLKEKKRLAKEKQAALKKAKTIKIGDKPTKPIDGVDIKDAAKTIKLALAQIAAEMSQYDIEKRAKKAKSISWMGYEVETKDGNVIARFTIEKSKKDKNTANIDVELEKPIEKIDATETVDAETVEDSNAVQEVEIVPAGDLYGQNGNVDGEVANLDDDESGIDAKNEDDEEENEDYDENEDDSSSFDSRDEQDEDIIDNRREFFNSFGDDFEPMDD